MALELKKKYLNEICEILIEYLKEGNTVEGFLTDFNFSKRKWRKLLSRSKKLKNTLEDGNTFYKAFWQRKLTVEMENKRSNSTLAKMAFENSLGLTEFAQKNIDQDKPAKRYKVYLDLGPESKGEKENDNIKSEQGQDKIFKEDVD